MDTLVRKAGTDWFMQAGGKIESGESPLNALCRELSEEIELMLCKEDPRYLGCYSAPAANEPAILSKPKFSMCERDMTPLRGRKLRKPCGSIT
ncbi:NUDIX domain-containing protein [Sphingomonas sp. AP4-R1]|uniref:NUDIX domain-containing protein n=1 Tax=Sphingomonas sp. AP4-R1 TaxID=2735134 RepID=UPI001C103EC8